MAIASGRQPTRRSRTPLFINLLVGTVCVLAILACGESSGSSGGSGSSATATSGVKAGTVLQTFTGSGPKKTSTFTVPDTWTLKYKCQTDANAQQYNVPGNLIVDVNAPDTTPIDYGAVNTTCGNTVTSDSTVEHQGGSVYLDIQSDNDTWTITVVAGG